jgi:hypothetical protein
MCDISKISRELLKFRENYIVEVDDSTFITINNLINKLYNTAKSNNLWWYPPKISLSNADGTVLLEWEHKDRVLLIDVLEDKIDYDALWGLADEESWGEESGDINIENDLTEFWEWIAD